jgi:gluconate 2-dehydrogenase gamma chain
MIPVEALDRRALLRGIALSAVAAGTVEMADAQHVHQATAAEKAKGAYKVKEFTAAEYKTLQRLAQIIVPADEVSASALEAGAPEFIDLLSSQNEKLAEIFHGGLAWLDAEMNKRYEKSFVNATPAQQTEMLDVLVAADKVERTRVDEEAGYRKSGRYNDFTGYTVNRAGPLGPGIRFFDWVRKMTVDAFYTSPIGIKDIGFMGNGAYTKYETPQASIDYAMKRSPFKA